jgi:TetR/AcrR family transcriptional regulator, ethionamide resistance regulator
MTPEVAVRSRNATEEAILDAARLTLADTSWERLTMDAIARRAFVSRTAVYFYFPSKDAVVERLVQRAFHDIYEAAAPYLDGIGEPRRELRTGLARVVAVVNREQDVFLLAARHSNRGERMPKGWRPFIMRLVEGATARIARDQRRGLAPDDIPAPISAQALLGMIEGHIVRDVIIGGADANDSILILSELWYRAVYAGAPKTAR